MHVGETVPNLRNKIMGSELTINSQEQDLGVIIDSSPKTSAHCSAEIKKKINKSILNVRDYSEKNREQNRKKSCRCCINPLCIYTWNTTQVKRDAAELGKLQRKVGRVIKHAE